MQGSVRSLARYILQVPIERRKPHGIYGAGTTGAADGCEPKGGAERGGVVGGWRVLASLLKRTLPRRFDLFLITPFWLEALQTGPYLL